MVQVDDDAFERAGGRYYPKLLVAVPFTPATGRRLLVPEGEDVTNYLKRQIRKSSAKNKRPTRVIDDAGLGFGDEPSDKPLDELFGN